MNQEPYYSDNESTYSVSPPPAEQPLVLLFSSDDDETLDSASTDSIPLAPPMEQQVVTFVSADDAITPSDSNNDASTSVVNTALMIHQDQVLPAAGYELSYPSFYDEIMSKGLYTDEHVALMRSRDWITDSLEAEILMHSPKSSDVIRNEDDNDSCYDPSSFKKACQYMFPHHRQFVNNIQIDQVFVTFLSNWNVFRNHSTRYISCAYSKGSLATQYLLIPLFIRENNLLSHL